MPRRLHAATLVALASSLLLSTASFSATAKKLAPAPTCDLTAPHFTPDQATPETAHPSQTRIPKEIVVEQSGFSSADAAAKCFGARYHDQRAASYITYIVRTDNGWGYLTPGKGGRDERLMPVADLQRAAQAAGHSLHAIARTHPQGALHFSSPDIAAALETSNGIFYLTNRRNETWRTDAPSVRQWMARHGYNQNAASKNRFLASLQKPGFQGTRVC